VFLRQSRLLPARGPPKGKHTSERERERESERERKREPGRESAGTAGLCMTDTLEASSTQAWPAPSTTRASLEGSLPGGKSQLAALPQLSCTMVELSACYLTLVLLPGALEPASSRPHWAAPDQTLRPLESQTRGPAAKSSNRTARSPAAGFYILAVEATCQGRP